MAAAEGSCHLEEQQQTDSLIKQQQIDSGKYVNCSQEQVEALERFIWNAQKPSLVGGQQLIRECSVLSNIGPKQIKVWSQTRRCHEKQRKESSRPQMVNGRLTVMKKPLMEENA
ncbi:hypothetical protein HPP92_003700 [Vanilla planifolia]|uniref:Homeobox domain-containing protein n=1 Tax=Vanilla planifolia TaxID=51239 RepID=A0A835VHV5_VANPL|nr:hypothetical protein HPP92_004153 [Vanilla planifolia]KAG0503628.1 hypothetical protein HPP92_003700 [Vanilla planifolia]